MMPDILFYEAIILVDVCCVLIFADAFYRKLRSIKTLNAFCMFIISWMGASAVALLLDEYFFLKQIVLVLFYSVIIWFYFSRKFFFSFLIPFISHVLMILTELLLVRLWHYFISYDFVNILDFNIYNMLLVILSRIVTILVILIFYNKNGHSEALKNRDLLLFSIIPFFSFIIISAIVINWGLGFNAAQEVILAWVSLGLLMMNIMVFYIIQSTIVRESKIRSYELFISNVNNNLHLYDVVSESYDAQIKRAHEYSNNIECIAGLMRDKKYDELRDLLNVIKEDIDLNIKYINSGNAVINAILNTKIIETRKLGIGFNIIIGDLTRLKLKDSDMVIILFNVLNNAIEAAQKSDNAYIRLKLVIEKDEILLSVINSIKIKPIHDGGRFFSTKPLQRIEHGYGITNTIEIVKKYNGLHSIGYNSDEFVFTIIIPLYNI